MRAVEPASNTVDLCQDPSAPFRSTRDAAWNCLVISDSPSRLRYSSDILDSVQCPVYGIWSSPSQHTQYCTQDLWTTIFMSSHDAALRARERQRVATPIRRIDLRDQTTLRLGHARGYGASRKTVLSLQLLSSSDFGRSLWPSVYTCRCPSATLTIGDAFDVGKLYWQCC